MEAIRALMVAKRSAAGERTQTINQARALILTGPDDLRIRFTGHTAAALVTGLASLRPRPGEYRRLRHPHRAARAGTARGVPRRPARAPGRAHRPAGRPPAPPGLLALYGVGPHTAALLLIAAGDHPGGCAARPPGRTCARVAPIPASSGKVARHRLNPGGDRQANHALWRIVFTRLGSDPATRAYAERRTAEGKSKTEIIRCLKRYVAREVYRHLRPAAASAQAPGGGLTR